jgi:hypothetical protein
LADEVVDAGTTSLPTANHCSCDAVKAELRKKDKELRYWRQEAEYQRYLAEKGQRLHDAIKLIVEQLRAKTENK